MAGEILVDVLQFNIIYFFLGAIQYNVKTEKKPLQSISVCSMASKSVSFFSIINRLLLSFLPQSLFLFPCCDMHAELE